MNAKAEELAKAYRWETDEELERKRQVYRSHIVGMTTDEILAKALDVDQNREMYETISRIIRTRERNKRIWGEAHRWATLMLPVLTFALGLLVATAWPASLPS